MRTKKNEKQGIQDTKLLESGKQVMQAGLPETQTKGAKLHPETSANETDDTTTWEAAVYESMRDGVNLLPLHQSVSLKHLRQINGNMKVSEFVASIDKRNARMSEENRHLLLLNGLRALYGYTFASVEERTLAIKKAKARYLNTNGFRTTFQKESDEDTNNTYEEGAYYSKPSTFSAAGIRTSFNSVEYTKRTAELLRKRAETERKANEAREQLANVDTSALLAHLTPSQLAGLLAKVNGTTDTETK